MYDNKTTDYFTHVRMDILGALGNKTFQNVLELGAGGCDTLLYMKQNRLAAHVTGVELFNIENSNQRHADIDQIFIESIEKLNILPLKKEYYDLIICGDILEHVFDPWSILKQIRQFLTTNGMLICSIPNFRELQTMKQIFFQGDFKYNAEGGILDKTHVRFFCKKNIIDLVEGSGYRIMNITPTFKWAASQKKRRIANSFTCGIFEEFFAFQYLVQIQKNLIL